FTGGALAAEVESEGDRRPCMEQSMHGFETKFLAQLFSPKPSMSDQRFQVAIDKVLFVGHPLRDDPNERAQDPDYYDTEQDEADSMSRFASMTDFDGWKVKSDMMVGRASRHHGTKLLADLGLLNLMMHREPSEAGDSAISEGEWAVRDSKEWKRRGYRKPRYDSLFHIVFMLDNTAPGVETLANLLYGHVLKRLTKALQIEQNGANYVLTESRVIRSLNDMALKDRYTSARYIQELVARSSLACDLIKLYNGLRNSELVNLHIHKRIMVSLQIPSGPRLNRPVPTARPRAFFNSGYGQTGHNSNNLVDRSNVVSLATTPRPATPSESTPGSALDISAASQLQLSQRLDALRQVSQSVAPPVQEYWGPALFAPSQSGDIGFNYESSGAMARGLPAKPWTHTHQGKGMARGVVEQADVIVTGRELREHQHGLYPRIKPYHAILLLGDTNTLRRQLLFADASPTLVAVIERATPNKTLAMLHTL
ncbi:Nitrogen permease regulator 3, partial [Linderina pennispora]